MRVLININELQILPKTWTLGMKFEFISGRSYLDVTYGLAGSLRPKLIKKLSIILGW